MSTLYDDEISTDDFNGLDQLTIDEMEADHDVIATPEERIAELQAVLRDIVFGADAMLQPALALTGSFRGYVLEVKRVAQLAVDTI